MTALVTVEGVAILFLALLVAGLLRSHAEILRALHDLGAGASSRVAMPVPRQTDGATTAVDLAGRSPSGESTVIGVVGAERLTLLAFLTSGCYTCKAFWDAFSDPQRVAAPGDARVVILTKGVEAESEVRIAQLAPRDLPVVMSSEAWDHYRVSLAPYFVLVAGGRIAGEGAASTWEQVVTLVQQAVDDTELAAGRAAGEARRTRAEQRVRADALREARADNDLMAAGIYPGHPSLYAPVEHESDPAAE